MGIAPFEGTCGGLNSNPLAAGVIADAYTDEGRFPDAVEMLGGQTTVAELPNGYGDGDGYGYGNGNGYGDGDGDGYGNGYGNGNGYGYGDGYGYGNGYGDGDGDGYGDGYGNRPKY